ncbi:hypothetical protein CXG81DRAFT_23709 [Caulochytrium protostelioides]|uniref:Uncharacterized protein n=1 Tax=Caulochytrium protostelioides TaxID=1555241 RepID=A0A4P9XDX5_9FUNG|nr:hypothetical protein CXG81DRAFT_23709 [Caulochytrium protostelioides]|eukprot:RKP03736.1 hypothetical protein CXG81DRAFT_23709 [Caulochytrium protostelioides]
MNGTAARLSGAGLPAAAAAAAAATGPGGEPRRPISKNELQARRREMGLLTQHVDAAIHQLRDLEKAFTSLPRKFPLGPGERAELYHDTAELLDQHGIALNRAADMRKVQAQQHQKQTAARRAAIQERFARRRACATHLPRALWSGALVSTPGEVVCDLLRLSGPGDGHMLVATDTGGLELHRVDLQKPANTRLIHAARIQCAYGVSRRPSPPPAASVIKATPPAGAATDTAPASHLAGPDADAAAAAAAAEMSELAGLEGYITRMESVPTSPALDHALAERRAGLVTVAAGRSAGSREDAARAAFAERPCTVVVTTSVGQIAVLEVWFAAAASSVNFYDTLVFSRFVWRYVTRVAEQPLLDLWCMPIPLFKDDTSASGGASAVGGGGAAGGSTAAQRPAAQRRASRRRTRYLQSSGGPTMPPCLIAVAHATPPAKGQPPATTLTFLQAPGLEVVWTWHPTATADELVEHTEDAIASTRVPFVLADSQPALPGSWSKRAHVVVTGVKLPAIPGTASTTAAATAAEGGAGAAASAVGTPASAVLGDPLLHSSPLDQGTMNWHIAAAPQRHGFYLLSHDEPHLVLFLSWEWRFGLVSPDGHVADDDDDDQSDGVQSLTSDDESLADDAPRLSASVELPLIGAAVDFEGVVDGDEVGRGPAMNAEADGASDSASHPDRPRARAAVPRPMRPSVAADAPRDRPRASVTRQPRDGPTAVVIKACVLSNVDLSQHPLYAQRKGKTASAVAGASGVGAAGYDAAAPAAGAASFSEPFSEPGDGSATVPSTVWKPLSLVKIPRADAQDDTLYFITDAGYLHSLDVHFSAPLPPSSGGPVAAGSGAYANVTCKLTAFAQNIVDAMVGDRRPHRIAVVGLPAIHVSLLTSHVLWIVSADGYVTTYSLEHTMILTQQFLSSPCYSALSSKRLAPGTTAFGSRMLLTGPAAMTAPAVTRPTPAERRSSVSTGATMMGAEPAGRREGRPKPENHAIAESTAPLTTSAAVALGAASPGKGSSMMSPSAAVSASAPAAAAAASPAPMAPAAAAAPASAVESTAATATTLATTATTTTTSTTARLAGVRFGGNWFVLDTSDLLAS